MSVFLGSILLELSGLVIIISSTSGTLVLILDKFQFFTKIDSLWLVELRSGCDRLAAARGRDLEPADRCTLIAWCCKSVATFLVLLWWQCVSSGVRRIDLVRGSLAEPGRLQVIAGGE